MSDYPAIDLTPYWASLNDDLITIVDAVPDDKLNWTPKPELWNFRGILLHIAGARDGWLGNEIADGDTAKSVYETTRSKPDIQREYRRTWQRLERFLRDAEKLDATYHFRDDNGTESGDTTTGHWIAFHLLEHDIHHRSDLLHYLALLGEPMPNVSPL